MGKRKPDDRSAAIERDARRLTMTLGLLLPYLREPFVPDDEDPEPHCGENAAAIRMLDDIAKASAALTTTLDGVATPAAAEQPGEQPAATRKRPGPKPGSRRNGSGPLINGGGPVAASAAETSYAGAKDVADGALPGMEA